jgi:hypothetical protein
MDVMELDLQGLVRSAALPAPVTPRSDSGLLRYLEVQAAWSARAYRCVAHAKDAAELRRAAEGVLDDEEWRALTFTVAREAPSLLSRILTLRAFWKVVPLRVPFEGCVSPEIAERARHSLRWSILVSCEYLDRNGGRPSIAPSTSDDMFGYLTDRHSPREMRRALLERDVAHVLRAAMHGAELRSEVPPQWMIDASFERFGAGLRPWFDLMASAFGLEVPDDLRQHTDWRAVVQAHRELQAARRSAVARYEEGGRQPMLVLPPDRDSTP